MNMKKEVMHLLICMSSSWVIILLHNNAWPHAPRKTLQKLTDLAYKTFPPFSSNLSLIDYHFFKHLDIFLSKKAFHSKGEMRSRNCILKFLGSKTFRVLSYMH